MAKITILLVMLCVLASMADTNTTTTESTGVLVPESTSPGTTDTLEEPPQVGCTSGRRRKWRTMHRNQTDSDELETPDAQDVLVVAVSGADEGTARDDQGCRWRKRKYRRRHHEVGSEDEDGDCGRGRRKKWRRKGGVTESAVVNGNKTEVVGVQDLGAGILIVENSEGDVGLIVVVEDTTKSSQSRKKSRCRQRSRTSRRRSRKNRRKWSKRRKLTTVMPPMLSEEYEDISDPVDAEVDADEEVMPGEVDADVEVMASEEDPDVEQIEDNGVDIESIQPVMTVYKALRSSRTF